MIIIILCKVDRERAEKNNLAIGGVEKVWRVRGHAPDEYAKNPAARVLRRRRKVHTHTHTHTQDKTRHEECDIKGVGAHTHASVF